MPSYLIAVLLVFTVWAVLYFLNPRVRKQMWIIGTTLTPFVIFDVLTVPEYWEPVTVFNLPIGIEGVLFTFFVTGIAAVLYEVVFAKSYQANKIQISLTTTYIVPVLISGFLVYFFKLNIIYLFILSFTFMAVAQLLKRPDLFFNAIASSLLFGMLYYLLFSIWLHIAPESIAWWNHAQLSHIRVGNVLLEELLFGLSVGFFAGPLYEYLTNAKVRSS